MKIKTRLLALVAVLGLVAASCSLPVAYPPHRNAEDRPGPDFTIWMRNIGYPCEPPLWPLTTDDRNWESGIPAHGCVFEYTWMFEIGWCYDRDLALYGSAPTGAGNCSDENLNWANWETRLFRWSLDEVMDGTFFQWCIDNGMSCAPISAPWRNSMGVRSQSMTFEEVMTADSAEASAYPGAQAQTALDPSNLGSYSLAEQSDMYWDYGGMAQSAEVQTAVEGMGNTDKFVTWRDSHAYWTPIAGINSPCSNPADLGKVFNTTTRGNFDQECWRYTWMWHAGWCSPGGRPFPATAAYLSGKDHWCPNGKWPLTQAQSVPLMQYDSVRKFWEPTATAQTWIDNKFKTGWLPTNATGW